MPLELPATYKASYLLLPSIQPPPEPLRPPPEPSTASRASSSLQSFLPPPELHTCCLRAFDLLQNLSDLSPEPSIASRASYCLQSFSGVAFGAFDLAQSL
jgi:hypothetical protein